MLIATAGLISLQRVYVDLVLVLQTLEHKVKPIWRRKDGSQNVKSELAVSAARKYCITSGGKSNDNRVLDVR